MIFLFFPSAIYVFFVHRQLTCILWQWNSCLEEIISDRCLDRKYLEIFHQVSCYLQNPPFHRGTAKLRPPDYIFLMLISIKKKLFKYVTLSLRVSLTWTMQKLVYLMSQNKRKLILTIPLPCLFGDHIKTEILQD